MVLAINVSRMTWVPRVLVHMKTVISLPWRAIWILPSPKASSSRVRTNTGVPRSYGNITLWDPTEELYLGPYGSPRGGGCLRCIPVVHGCCA